MTQLSGWGAILFRVMGATAVFSCVLAPFCLIIFDIFYKNDPCPPLAPNQVDIESEGTSEGGGRGCIDLTGWTFRNAASQPVPYLLAPYISQAEYSEALAGVTRAMDESSKCGEFEWMPAFWLLNAITMFNCLIPCCCYQLGIRNLKTIRRIDDALAPFRQKGLQAQFIINNEPEGLPSRGREGYPARIRVTVPLAAAAREAKKLKVTELRAALEAAGADTKGLKAALVERLVGVKRAAAQKG